eukprot:m.541892 g.541892  ORF g.541892 m.541892 type:complete len:429 (+) comp57654_c0_seq2:1340-2626(+)
MGALQPLVLGILIGMVTMYTLMTATEDSATSRRAHGYPTHISAVHPQTSKISSEVSPPSEEVTTRPPTLIRRRTHPQPPSEAVQVGPEAVPKATLEVAPRVASELAFKGALEAVPEPTQGVEKLFDFSPREPNCNSVPGERVDVQLRQAFITADEQPVSWKMFVHPYKEDVWVSASVTQVDNGNTMFEMGIRKRIYECLRGTLGQYPAPKDPLFLDVGANIGTHGLFTAALGIRTHAFEPMPKNLAVLLCSQLNNPTIHRHLVVNDFGLSETNNDGACMKVERGNQGNSYFDTSDRGCTMSGIKLRRLDDYWDQILRQERVFLIKMDVQGFEGFVLRGGRRMLESKPPVFIFMEFTPYRYRQYGVDPAAILKELRDLGYSIAMIYRGEPLTERELDSMANSKSPGLEFDLELTHTASLEKLKLNQLEP